MNTIHKIIHPIAKRLPESNRLERIWKLAQVDFKKRYYNDRLGLLWALLNPLFRIGIYYVVFTYIIEMERIENYAVFLFCGLVPWLGFKEAASKGIGMVKSKKYLIENIQFDYTDLYLSSTISVFLGLIFNTIVLLVACLVAGIQLSSNLIYIPLLYFNLFLLGMGMAMILTTVRIFLEDIVHLWAMIVLFGFWTSGVFMRGEIFLEMFPILLYVQPFIGLLINMRNVTMYSLPPDFFMLTINMFAGVIVLLGGIFIFKRNISKAVERI